MHPAAPALTHLEALWAAHGPYGLDPKARCEGRLSWLRSVTGSGPEGKPETRDHYVCRRCKGRVTLVDGQYRGQDARNLLECEGPHGAPLTF